MNEFNELLSDILDPETYNFAKDKVRSDRYLSICGEPAYTLTIHGTENQLNKLVRFLEMEGIHYE